MQDPQRRSTGRVTAWARAREPSMILSDVLWLRHQLDQIASSPVVRGARNILADVIPVLEPVWSIVGLVGDRAEAIGHLRRFGDRDASLIAQVRLANASVEHRAMATFEALDLATPSRRQIWEALARPANALVASIDVSACDSGQKYPTLPMGRSGSLCVAPRPLLPGDLLTEWNNEAQVVPVLRHLLRSWCDIARNATGERRDVAQLTLAAALLARGAALEGDIDTVRWFVDRWLGLIPTETRVDGTIAALLTDGWRRTSVTPEFSAVQDTVTDLRVRATYLRTEAMRQHRLHRPVWETQLGELPVALLYDPLPGWADGADGSAPPSIADLLGVADETLQAASQTMLIKQLRAVLDTLSEREAAVALAYAEGKPWTEVARDLGVTRHRLDAIRRDTFSKLRHPSRSQVLRDYLDD